MNKNDWAQQKFYAIDGRYYDTEIEAYEASKKQYTAACFSQLIKHINYPTGNIIHVEEHARWFIDNVEQILKHYKEAIKQAEEYIQKELENE